MKREKKSVWFVCAIVFAVLCNVNSVYAKNIQPISISVSNDEQVKIDLSNQDINRVFVLNDKITRVNSPSGRIIAHNDQLGSIFMTVFGERPFTLFLTTKKGHQYSLLVIPKSEPGATVKLVPNGFLKGSVERHSDVAKQFEQASPYEKTLVALLKDVMMKQTVSGFSYVLPKVLNEAIKSPHISTLSKNRFLKEEVVGGYLGGDLAVRVLRITNHGRKPIKIAANMFFVKGVRAVAIEDDNLLPHRSTLIYEVVSNV